MKRWLSFMVSAVLVFSLSACSTVDLNTPKSEELSKQYDYYSDSMNKIRAGMDITPEQADEVFIALVSIGVNNEISSVTKKYGTDNTYSVSWAGSIGGRDVDISDGVVSEIRNGIEVLYPLERSTSTLNAQALEDVTALIDGLNGDSSRSDYEAAQSAFDALSGKLQKELPESLVSKLSEYNLSTLTIEQSVDSAIEKAGAGKDKVTITENAGTENVDDVIVSVYLKGTDNLTNNMIRGGMLIQASDILEQLQSRSDISRVALFWSFPLVDAYGNTKEETVMKIQLDGDSLRNINFEKFDRNNFSTIADDYFEHPALSEK